jgi:hypothetical protein
MTSTGECTRWITLRSSPIIALIQVVGLSPANPERLDAQNAASMLWKGA